MTRQVQLLKGEAQISAWNAMGRPAPNTTSDPGQIALGLLQMSWLRVAAYSDMLRRQVQSDLSEAAAREGGQGTGDGQGTEGSGGASDGLKVEGLIGHTYSATSTGEIYEASEAVRALVTLEAQERDRAMNFAVQAHKMGISNRLTALAEQWGDVVAGRVAAMLADLDLTPDQQKRVPLLVQSYLGSIDMESIGK